MELNRDTFRKLPLALRIEVEENAQRKPLTQSELAIEQRRILSELRKLKKPGERTEVRATSLVGKLFNESHMQVRKRLAKCALMILPRKTERRLPGGLC